MVKFRKLTAAEKKRFRSWSTRMMARLNTQLDIIRNADWRTDAGKLQSKTAERTLREFGKEMKARLAADEKSSAYGKQHKGGDQSFGTKPSPVSPLVPLQPVTVAFSSPFVYGAEI
jgi:hypothetical protein